LFDHVDRFRQSGKVRLAHRPPKSILRSTGMVITRISRPTGRLTCAYSMRADVLERKGAFAQCENPRLDLTPLYGEF
jgi:hypothetical protein